MSSDIACNKDAFEKNIKTWKDSCRGREKEIVDGIRMEPEKMSLSSFIIIPNYSSALLFSTMLDIIMQRTCSL